MSRRAICHLGLISEERDDVMSSALRWGCAVLLLTPTLFLDAGHRHRRAHCYGPASCFGPASCWGGAMGCSGCFSPFGTCGVPTCCSASTCCSAGLNLGWGASDGCYMPANAQFPGAQTWEHGAYRDYGFAYPVMPSPTMDQHWQQMPAQPMPPLPPAMPYPQATPYEVAPEPAAPSLRSAPPETVLPPPPPAGITQPTLPLSAWPVAATYHLPVPPVMRPVPLAPVSDVVW